MRCPSYYMVSWHGTVEQISQLENIQRRASKKLLATQLQWTAAFITNFIIFYNWQHWATTMTWYFITDNNERL